jgi:hypothetical protein
LFSILSLFLFSSFFFFAGDQSAQRKSADKQQKLSLFRSTGSRTALLQVRTCAVTLFSHGEERAEIT